MNWRVKAPRPALTGAKADERRVLAGDWKPPKPSVGRRNDGLGLFYRGKVHTVAAETEAGKTWLALAAVRDEVALGHHVVYLDFEDDEGGVVGRLRTIGLETDELRRLVQYIRPQTEIGDSTHLQDLVRETRPTLVVIDGVTEAVIVHGLDLLNNKDVAMFSQILPRMLADLGPAVVCLDHVVKNRDSRGRYAIGAVHKLNAVDGAAYILENQTPFGIGATGTSTIQISKDRPGQLRRHGVTPSRDLVTYAELVLASSGPDFATLSVESPSGTEPIDQRPLQIMQEVCDALESLPAGA